MMTKILIDYLQKKKQRLLFDLNQTKELLKSVNESWRAAIAFFSIKAKEKKRKEKKRNVNRMKRIVKVTFNNHHNTFNISNFASDC